MTSATSVNRSAVSRSYSDSSAKSSDLNKAAAKVNRSMENVPSKHQQLLKLSFFNSPNSPMNSTSFNNTTLAESVFQEARKIAKKFADSDDSSFEDLNNISSQLIESDASLTDLEFEDMKVKVSQKKLPPRSKSPSTDKIAQFQEQLNRIKQEQDPELPALIKQEPNDGSGVETELDGILKTLKTVINNGNKDEAKKHLQRLNELLGKQQEPNTPAEARNTLQVHPIIRQDTFDIDPETGKRKYKQTNQKTDNADIMEKLAELLGAQALNIHSIDAMGGKLVVVVPTPVSTPNKNPQPGMSMSLKRRPLSAMKADDGKKQSTPMKTPMATHVKRLSTFATPRPATVSKGAHPYEQKLSVQSRAGAVRKSLMGSMERGPQFQKPKDPATVAKPRPSVAPRRSVSMKASIPAVQVTKSSPKKAATPRPSLSAPHTSKAPSTPRMSLVKKPDVQLKKPQARKPAKAVDVGSLV